MSYNIGYKFYKEYFEKLKIERDTGIPIFDGKEINDTLFQLNLAEETPVKFDISNNSFRLQTTYPGLLIGSGYIHEIGSNEKDGDGEYYIKHELKLGFFFDYTSGLPCIPGSSVKGVLRNAFTLDKGGYVKWIIEELASGERESKVQAEAKKVIKENPDVFLFKDTGKIKNEKPIFEESEFIKTVFEAPENTSIYKRDVFFDAFPVSAKNGLLANDYITPHKDPLKNPTPLQFMKVLPEVEFEFRFKLVDTNRLTAKFKLELFRQILLDQGIGAKTNVGYGQFDDEKDRVNKTSSSSINNISPHTDNKPNYPNGTSSDIILKQGEVLAEYIKPDPKINNHVLLKIISEGAYMNQEIAIRYPGGMNDKQKLIIKLSLTKKKKIQSATVSKML